ncbi:hypothetical protein E5360_06600 [Muribaculum intestinale]|uniref:hypothetical protein n=1 Tax=Muribaculum intestinale TaxID=1796646 RepID=UPI001093B0CB|nr:hypothetical protein [Muribaculum intestinale]TGX84436.1 hypothetical protein E5360_06600 [Muribaculum intestinale]
MNEATIEWQSATFLFISLSSDTQQKEKATKEYASREKRLLSSPDTFLFVAQTDDETPMGG